MKLCEKIVSLRKSRGMSQEELAEKVNVSRQAVSRWEVGSAMPDAGNILQLSRLFGVTADYLLNDEYESDHDVPQVQEAKQTHYNQILFFMIILEVLNLLMQFMCVVVLRNGFVFSLLSFVPFLCMIGGFEWGFRKRKGKATRETIVFRKRFYMISSWLGTYFPVRFVTLLFRTFNLGPYSIWVKEITILTHYICVAALLTLFIEKRDLMRKK